MIKVDQGSEAESDPEALGDLPGVRPCGQVEVATRGHVDVHAGTETLWRCMADIGFLVIESGPAASADTYQGARGPKNLCPSLSAAERSASVVA